MDAVEAVKIMDAPSLSSGSAFLDGEDHTFNIRPKGLIELLFSDFA